jgi:NADH-quinone oxidoreductase subunit E
MLTDEEKREIESGRHPNEPRDMAVPEALKIVQRRNGWVSDEGVRDIAEYLGVTADQVDAIATFYTLIFRRPVGRHVILICDSVSCWVMEYNEIREHLAKRWGLDLGQTTADGRFTLLPTACLGACDLAPVMMVDKDLHGNLTPEKVDRILERYE